MKITQATIYRLGQQWPISAEQLETALAREPFAEIGTTQEKSTGWVPPRGQAHGPLVEAVAGHWVARWRADIKTVPGAELRRVVDAHCAVIEAETGRKPGKRERRDLMDETRYTLLPIAFARTVTIWVWIDRTADRLILGTSSLGRSDEVLTHLVRVADQGMTIGALQTKQSALAAMASWLAAESPEQLPDAFHVERDCELRGLGDEPATIRFARHDLATDEIRQHIREGKLPTWLGLGWQGRVGFTLTHQLHLKKIAFMDGVLEDAAQAEHEDRFDADVALSTGELSSLISDLIGALGGESPTAGVAP